jgi:hypothetical protein
MSRIQTVRITLDEQRDQATIYLSDEPQTYEGGSTYLVLASDEEKPRPESVEVQLGFEGERRLLFIMVRPASEALPAALLTEAERF